MKITKVKATPFNLYFTKPYVWSLGVAQGTSKVLVEIETDEGIVGLGEGVSDGLYATILGIGEALVGKDPLDLVNCELSTLSEWRRDSSAFDSGDSSLPAFGAIDMALWDIKGKYCNLPLYKLLGGAYRTKIAFTEYFGFYGKEQAGGAYTCDYDVQEVVEACLAAKENKGTTYFEGKIAGQGVGLQQDVLLIKSLREALGPEAMLRLDANYGLSPAAAKRFCREIEPYHVCNLEDPVLSFEAMAELKRYTALDISTHTCDLRRAVSTGGVDNFCGHPTLLGGVMNTIKFIGACEQFGKGFWFYSGDAGVTTALYLHLSAACLHLTQPSQALFNWQEHDIIQGGPFRPVHNVVSVPTGPGLGVEIDREMLAHLHKCYLDNGPCGGYYNFANPSKFLRLPTR